MPIPVGVEELWKLGQFERIDLAVLSPDDTTALLSETLVGSIEPDMWLRRTMDESANYKLAVAESDADTERGSLRVLLSYPRECLTVVGLTLGGTIAFYTFTTYMQKFMINTAGLPKEQVTWINFVALLIFVCIQPAFGALSDRIGRRPLLIAFGVGATLCTVPLLTAVSHTQSALPAFGLMMVGLIIVSGYTSINAVVKAELFPARIRALGVGLPYALTVAIFGGSTEYVALWLKNIGHENWFFFYVAGCGLISLLVYFFMVERHRGGTKWPLTEGHCWPQRSRV